MAQIPVLHCLTRSACLAFALQRLTVSPFARIPSSVRLKPCLTGRPLGGLLFLLQNILQFGLVLGLPAGAWLVVKYPRWFGLAHAFACIGFDGLGGRETGWLAFRHG